MGSRYPASGRCAPGKHTIVATNGRGERDGVIITVR